MSIGIIGLIIIVLFLAMLFAGIKIGVTLMTISLIGVYLVSGSVPIAVNLIGTTAYNAIKDYVYAVIPLFVLMGLFASMAGAGEDLYNSMNLLLRKVRGGLTMATVMANAIFAALTGATIASAAVFTKISLPEMVRLKYDKKFSAGTVAGTSVLGMLIPPSNLMIIFGTLSAVSIGKLFIAGILPGIILAILYIGMIVVLGRIKPHLLGIKPKDTSDENEPAEQEAVPEGSSWKIILKPWPIMLLILLVIGGIWGGMFTATEAGGVGAVGALIIALAKRKVTWKGLWKTLGEAGKTTGSILFLLIAAQMFSRMLAITGIISGLTNWVAGLGLAPLAVVAVFCVIQILMGCVIDSSSIILITTPLFVPIIAHFGFDLVWYGIVAVVAAEVGLISPPFGISVYTVKSSLTGTNLGDITTSDIFKGSYPYLLMMIVCLALIVLIPVLVTFLPSLM